MAQSCRPINVIRGHIADSVRRSIKRTFVPAYETYDLTSAFARVMSFQLYRG